MKTNNQQTTIFKQQKTSVMKTTIQPTFFGMKMKTTLLAAMCFVLSAQVTGQTDSEWRQFQTMTGQFCKMMTNMPVDETGATVAEVSRLQGFGIECYCEMFAERVTEKLKTDYLTGNLSDEELIATAMTYAREMFDENSPTYNELMAAIQEACAGDVSDITVSGPPRAHVPLVRIGSMVKVRATIGASSKYFLLDSGAGESVVSAAYASELYANGQIAEFLDPGVYELADGSMVECDRILVRNIRLGDYLLKNVSVAVSPDEVGFLLGKNILNAFSSWRVDNQKGILELIK
jgi:hypothetical protein